MIFVDAHVHIYDCFDVDFLLDSALKNFQAAEKQYTESGKSSAYVLLLTEGRSEHWFRNVLATFEKGVEENKKISKNWESIHCGGCDSLTVFRSESPGEKIHLVDGRQVVTREKIEVLALFCNTDIDDGLSLTETVDAVKRIDGIPVLPWGVGKWFGKRGESIRSFLLDHSKETFFLGDNGGRPWFWPTPNLFKLAGKVGVEVLPGTDPLPLAVEASRVGSFGFYVDKNDTHEDSIVADLKRLLLFGKIPIMPYGRLQNNMNFVLNQVRLKYSSRA